MEIPKPCCSSKNRLVCIFTSLVLISIFTIAGFLIRQNPSQPKPVLVGPPIWRGIIPGRSTKQEVVALLGEPVSVVNREGLEVYDYPSDVRLITHGIGFRGGVVVVIGVTVSPQESYSLSDATREYGKPEKVTYSYYDQGARSYVFASHGIRLIADEDTGQVFHMQYFVPMSLADYMVGLGKDLPLENPFVR